MRTYSEWQVPHTPGKPRTITLPLIANLRAWVHPHLGNGTLVIERQDGATKVALRFTLESGISEIEVADLLALKRRNVSQTTLMEYVHARCL